MDAHRDNPMCASCHAKMDPLGFAFEHFDAVGRYREKDGDEPIDAAGVFETGEPFLRRIQNDRATFGPIIQRTGARVE